MAEYIEREAAYRRIVNNKKWSSSPSTMDYAAELMLTLPAADVVEVVHGEWIETDWVEYDGHGECIHHHKEALLCSNCRHAFKKELLWKHNFCPNCGAKMDGKEQKE